LATNLDSIVVLEMGYNDSNMTLQGLKAAVQNFVKDREWQKYHTPRNLAESISIEASELLELFQWSIKEEESSVDAAKLEDELADVMIYCLSLSNAAGIDITRAVLRKLGKNEERYPKETNKGIFVKC